MSSIINYQNIFSRFFIKVEGYDLFGDHMTDESRNELLCSWLHSAFAKPYVSRLFSSVILTDPYQDINPETQEEEDIDGTIEYELKYKIDEDFGDENFITEVLAYGMALCWLEPKLYSLTNIAQFLGTSDEKFFSQQTHIQALRDLQTDLITAQRAIIRDRGYANNSYLDGTSVSSTLRSG